MRLVVILHTDVALGIESGSQGIFDGHRYIELEIIMNITEGIKTRRSIRKFKADKVDASVISDIVSVSTYAPSWKNSQTTRYVAVLSEDVKNRIADECMMGFEHNNGITKNAPAIMVITTVNCRSGYERDGSFTTSKGTHWQSFDAGIATEAFCLAAHEAGLGTVIMGIFDEAKVKEVIGLSEAQSVSALVAIGYPDEAPVAPKRKTPDDILSVI